MNLIPLTGDSTAALMGSGKISGFQRERERLINVHSAPNSSSDTPLFTHLHSQTHSQFTCAVRPHQLHFASQQCAAESHLFVSQAQGGENSLTPLFGAWEGHMTTKWWRLSAVGKPSIPDAERYRHTSMIWNPGQEIELCLSRGGECIVGDYIRLVVIWNLENWDGKERGRNGHLFVMHLCLITEEA